MDYAQEKSADKAHDAPELDQSALAPEPYSLGRGPQLPYGKELGLDNSATRSGSSVGGLQLRIDDEGLQPSRINDADAMAAQKNRKRKGRKILIAIIVCVFAAALGIGLGVGLKHQDTAPASATQSSTPTSLAPTSSAPTSTSLTVPPSSTATQVPLNGMLDNTSLAAVTTIEDQQQNRHVFFQDTNQSLRHTVFEQSAGKWLDADYVTTAVLPKNHTPLAALQLDTRGIDTNINLFYVDVNDFLAAVEYSPGESENQGRALFNSTLKVKPDTRTLSIAQLPSIRNYTIGDTVLLYEAPSGNITVLHGYAPTSNAQWQWQWQNISDAIYTPLSKNGLWLEAPLAASAEGNTSSPGINIYFLNNQYDSLTSGWQISGLSFQNWLDTLPSANGTNVLPSVGVTKSNSTEDSDLLGCCVAANPNLSNYVIWLQDGKLIYSPNPSPSYTYPFSRLAWLSNGDGTVTFIYHQLTNGILAEDTFDDSVGWSTTNITIGTSP